MRLKPLKRAKLSLFVRFGQPTIHFGQLTSGFGQPSDNFDNKMNAWLIIIVPPLSKTLELETEVTF